jgi:4-hydroxy-tetrahydrodipicolinate reductase
MVATRDADALLDLDADCVVYTATADLRPMDAVDDICRILRSGKNVVSSSVVGLVHPTTLTPDITRKLEHACREGESSFLTSGIDPGFANDVLPLVMTGLCERWTEVRIQEIVNYATYDQPDVVFGTMGFGQPLDATPLLLTPGALSFGWGGTIRLLAEGLGLTLDEIRETHERIPAPETFETPIGTVEKGTMAALRFEVQGIVDGVPRLVVDHVTRLRDDLAPHWPRSDGGYRVIIEGVPRMVVSLDMEDEHGDHAVGGVVLTATRLVNAIPSVCAAEPGPLSALDLPLITGRGLMARD